MTNEIWLYGKKKSDTAHNIKPMPQLKKISYSPIIQIRWDSESNKSKHNSIHNNALITRHSKGVKKLKQANFVKQLEISRIKEKPWEMNHLWLYKKAPRKWERQNPYT